MARDYGEQIEKKYAEEALDRNAKATIQSNVYNCSVRWAKLFRIRKPLIKEVTCEKCGKVFKLTVRQNYVLNVKKNNLRMFSFNLS